MPASLEAEFLRAFDDLADPLFRHCYFRVSDREKAKDLVQEAFTRTWAYLARGGRVENFKAFLYRTAQNLIVDEARRKQPVFVETIADADLVPLSEDVAAGVANLFDADRVIKAMATLPDHYRDVLTLRFVDGMSPAEVAEALGVTENVVSVRTHRGVRKLRESLTAQPQS